jgi:hypothetical protein
MHSWSDSHQGMKSLDFDVEDVSKGKPGQFKTKSVKRSTTVNNYRIELQCIKAFN